MEGYNLFERQVSVKSLSEKNITALIFVEFTTEARQRRRPATERPTVIFTSAETSSLVGEGTNLLLEWYIRSLCFHAILKI